MAPAQNGIKKIDKVASVLAAFCALHCIFLPFVTFLPFLFLEKNHALFWALSGLLSIYSVWWAFQHKNKKTIIFAFFAWLWFAVVSLFGWSEWLFVFSSVGLVMSHFSNRPHQKRCCVHEKKHESENNIL